MNPLRRMTRSLVLLVLLGGLVALASVGFDDTGSRDADFVFAVHDEHVAMDPARISWSSDVRVARLMFEALLNYQVPSGKLEPAAAESYSVSEDELTYTFTIRRDARWSNGDPLTAHDFVYAWRRVLLPEFAGDYSDLMFIIQGGKEFVLWRAQQLAEFKPAPGAAEKLWRQTLERFDQTVGIRAPDERTLVVTLNRRVPYFLELVTFVTFLPVHPPSVEAVTTLNEETGAWWRDDTYWSDPKRIISNGPYKMDRRRFRRDLKVVANEYYWNRAAMKNSSILEKIIGDAHTAFLAYENGEIDWLPDLPAGSQLAAELARAGRDDVLTQTKAGTYFYNFNCMPTLKDGSPNPLFDARVRRALAMGFDRKVLVERVTRLNQPVAETFVPPDAIPGYEPPNEAGLPFDPDAARKLLAEAGYADPAKLRGLSILYNTGYGHEGIAQAIQRAWEDNLGLVVNLEGVEVKTFSQRMKTQNFTVCRASWFGDYRDPTTWLEKMLSYAGNNDCKYNRPEYDALLKRAGEERDPTRRFALLREAETMLLQDAPMAMIYQYITLSIFRPDEVRNLHHNAWNNWRLEFVEVNRR